MSFLKNILSSSLNLVLVIAIVIIINLLASKWYGYIDLTEDKLFTLEKSTTELITDIDNNVFVEVLLEGELNAEFVNLRKRTEEILNQFNKINNNVAYQFTDPSEGTVEEKNLRRENLRNPRVKFYRSPMRLVGS